MVKMFFNVNIEFYCLRCFVGYDEEGDKMRMYSLIKVFDYDVVICVYVV